MALPQIEANPNFEFFGFQGNEDFRAHGTWGFCQIGLPAFTGEPEVDLLFLRALGGRWGAKTTAGIIRDAMYSVSFPGSQGMIGVLTETSHYRAILPKLTWAFERLGLDRRKDWTLNKEHGILTLYNGSVIYLVSTNNVENIPGADISWLHLDEWRDMPRKVWDHLFPTIRQPGYPLQAWLTSTPGGKQHWCRKVFLPKKYAQENDEPFIPNPHGTYISYKAPTRDNPFVKEATYLNALAQMGGEGSLVARQELMGEEIIMEGLVCPGFDRAHHVKHPRYWPTENFKYRLAGIDFGWVHPSAMVVLGADSHGRRYIVDEFYQRGCTQDDLYEAAWNLWHKHQIQYMPADSEDPRLIAWLKRERNNLRMPVGKAFKRLSHTSGFTSAYGMINGHINDNKDGQQMFFVHPRCKNFIREIENYTWAKTRTGDFAEQPVQRNDDAMKAFIYADIMLTDQLEGRRTGVGTSELRIAA